ncbi:KR-domain-containing protein [Aspergillus eucalypticola CBS 122712]|uniref:KR-domain-containing protein n=1 Tax=Aspergillus eucalypticola (strain CBS 122712 / IBT 29274) TaxID=1448314 RepID=A0A317V1D3_ASPEC|nr:KR-domain-containing protein [Aspergillus eucalypticola CBS 122712]PWY66607.1 KR-domain-containing protein [Aspergillus eucalypticola CBS 122712]
MPAQAWYKALRDVGYSFGPSFQSQLEVEAVAGQRTNRGLVTFSEPPSSYPQSPYSIHPPASLWQGIRSAVGGALVPAVVDDLLINARDVAAVPVAVAAASAEFSGVGSPKEAHNYHLHIQVFDPASKRLLFKVTGLWYHKLDASPEFPERQHTFMHLHWKPQMSTLSDGQMRTLIQARLVEFSTLPFEKSVGRDMFYGDLSLGGGNCKYQFMPKNLASLRASQALLSETYPQAHMNMLDVTKLDVDLSMLPDMLDLAILQLGSVSSADLANALANVRRAMTPTAYLLVLGTSLVDLTEDTGSASVISGEDSDSGSSNWSMVGGSLSQVLDFLRGQGFERVVPLAPESLSEDTVFLAQLSSDKTIVSPPLATTSEVIVLHLTPKNEPLVKQLVIAGKAPSEQHLPLPAAAIAPSSVVVIVDEAIQHLTASGCKILWVTSGAQLDVTHPDCSLAYGMSRVIRAEDPCVNFTLLDVKSAVSTGSLEAICRTIFSLQQGHQKQDHEFVERDGVVHVSRVYPDTQMNADAEKEDAITTAAAHPPAQQTQNLHEHPSCVRLVCRQPGKLQSLCFAEVSSSPVPLQDDFIEVEMHAAGLNFKDLGKKDILGRRSLSMEPFNRNASYRALDILMSKMFELLASGSIRPIEPRTVFPYRDIAGAIRYMRGGEHIGKIITSREAPDNDPNVPEQIVPAPTQLRLRDDAIYLIVGGLRGLCGSLAVYLACHGAKHLAVIVIRDLISLGTRVELVQGDVSCLKDVRRAFRQAVKPVRGIIQGAMVLKDKIYTSMTVDGFRDVLPCKVSGTWNLHAVAQEQRGVDLDFFTLLSSISGLVGQKGQANYAAAGAFQDAFATYRRDRGLAACAVDLGVIEDVGYISERQEIATRGNPAATAQIITGIPFPQPEGAMLLRDARAATAAGKHGGLSQEMQTLLMLLQTSTADRSEQLAATIEVVNRHFMHSLGLAEPMEAAKPLSVYGLDSLAAVDFRNWLRQELEVVGAKTLSALCERILSRLLENADATVGERG